MRPWKIRYDRALGLWSVSEAGSGTGLVTNRLILDARATSGPGGELLVPSAELELRDDESVRLDDRVPPRGVPKVEEMREWVATFDETSGRWAAWRHDVPGVLVSAQELSIQCHAVTSMDRLHCLAELLVDGATNRTDSIPEANRATLRALAVYDQVVEVPSMQARPTARAPG